MSQKKLIWLLYPLNSYLRRANLHASKPVRMLIFTWERKLHLQSRACRGPHRYVASRHPPRSGKVGMFLKWKQNGSKQPLSYAPGPPQVAPGFVVFCSVSPFAWRSRWRVPPLHSTASEHRKLKQRDKMLFPNEPSPIKR